jgi:invasion protein IalB
MHGRSGIRRKPTDALLMEISVKKFTRSTLALASTLVIAGPVGAQTAPQPAAQAKPADPMSEVVCQKQQIVGSRLATRRVCLTRQQWLEQQSSDRQDVEKAQVPSAKNTPG